jgi:hypothetical protein
MNTPNETSFDKQIYYRLVALWVICEAFAGGIMHGIKLPFTGLIISSLAITCIILIAWHVPSKTAIIRATVIVAIFKLMLSPYSPFTAYIAVFFQGLVGQLLFSGKKRFFAFCSVILAVAGLVESAIQRILVLMVVYGNDLWKAVNQFIHKLTGDKSITNYSLAIAVIYVSIHAVIGVCIGIYAARLAKRSVEWRSMYPELIITETDKSKDPVAATGRKSKVKWFFWICWLLLLAAFVHSSFFPEVSFLPADEVSKIIVRSVLIILGWYLVLSPLLMLVLKRILLNERLKKKEEVFEVMHLIPQTRFIFSKSWQNAAKEEGFERVKLFVKILLINTL